MPLTTDLHGIANVLARQSPYGSTPIQYANLTQARRMAEKLKADGVTCHVRSTRRPFYVIIEEAPE